MKIEIIDNIAYKVAEDLDNCVRYTIHSHMDSYLTRIPVIRTQLAFHVAIKLSIVARNFVGFSRLRCYQVPLSFGG